MDVRPARASDAPLVLRLLADQRSQLITHSNGDAWRSSGPSSMLRAAGPLRLRGRVWIAKDATGKAFLEAQPRQYVMGWDIVRLGVQGNVQQLLPPLVGSLLAHLQKEGVGRLFVRVMQEEKASFEMTGFKELARECVLSRADASVPEAGHPPTGTRYRMPEDAWPLHQLESEITPGHVRQLEGLSSAEWTQNQVDAKQVVVEHDGKVVAWAGCRKLRMQKRALISLLAYPEYMDATASLLHHVVKSAGRDSRLEARVREYHPELRHLLEASGFHMVSQHIIMVKHARVELAHSVQARMQMASVPSIPALQSRLP